MAVRFAGPTLLILLGAAALLLAGAASASSYTGSGDWVIGMAVNEVVTGENIVVNGNLTVSGTLTLVNSTLRMAWNDTPTPPAQPHNGHIFVTGTFNLRASTLTFDALMAAPVVEPPGFRISGTGRVNITDLDNSSATNDGSRVQASSNGTYHTMSPGTVLNVIHSQMVGLGYQDFVGVSSSRSFIYAYNARFEGQGVLIHASNCASFLVDSSTFFVSTAVQPIPPSTAIFTNGCGSPTVQNTLFDGNSIAWRSIGGTTVTATSIRLTNYGLGLVINQSTNVNIFNVSATAPRPHTFNVTWLQTGTVVGLVSTGVSFVMAINATFGNGTGPREPGAALYTSGVARLTFSDITVSNIASIAELHGPQNAQIQNIGAAAVDGGISIYNGNNVWVYNVTISDNPGTAFTVWDTTDFQLSFCAVDGSLGFDLLRSTRTAIDNVQLNTTGVAVLYDTGTSFNLTAITIRGPGSGIVISSATTVRIDGVVMEVGNYAVSLALTRNLSISSLSVTSFGPDPLRQLFLASNLTSTLLNTISFDGTCTSAGTFLSADTLTIDGLRVNFCNNGLAMVGGSSQTLRNIDLSRAINGSALTVSGVAGALVENADLSGAGGYGISVSASSSVMVRNINAPDAMTGGGIVQAGNGVDVQDSNFDGSNGTCFAIVNSTSRVTGARLSAVGCRIGVEVMSSGGAVLQEIDASYSAMMGVFIDSGSSGAELYSMTVMNNALQGISIDADGVTLVDGYIQGNGADGIAPSPGIRLDWDIRGSAAFLDGYTRMSGYITLYPGSNLDLERAEITFDPFMIVPDGGSWAPFVFMANSYAYMDEATFRSWNSTVPYGIEFQFTSSADISNSQFLGAARDHPDSKVFGNVSWLGIFASTFTGFYRPFDVGGDAVELTQVTFRDNARAARITAASVNLTQVVATDSDSHGLEVDGSTYVRALDVSVSNNSGTGAIIQNVGLFESWGLNARFNLQGGASFFRSGVLAYDSLAQLNPAFGIQVAQSSSAQFIGMESSTNPGVGLSVSGTSYLLVSSALITLNGGTGIDLNQVGEVRIEDTEISYAASVSMKIIDGDNVTGQRVTFIQATVAHLQVSGATIARFVSSSFLESPYGAVSVSDSSRVTFEDVDGDAGDAGLRASQASYALLQNSTFANSPRVDDSAQVDIAWNVRVRVLDENGSTVPGATVRFFNQTGSPGAEEATQGDGVTPLIMVLMRSYFSGGRFTAHSPYNITAEAPAEGRGRGTFSISAYALLTLTLDSRPPMSRVILDGPEGENGWFTGTVTAIISGVDGPNGVPKLSWRLSGGAWNSTLGNNGVAEITLTLETEGATVIEFYSEDANGNTEPIQSVTVLIDMSGPSVAITVPASPHSTAGVVVNWTAVAGPSGAKVTLRIEHSFNGGPWTLWQTWVPNASAPTEGSAVFSAQEGQYTFRAQATDEAGLVSQAAEASVQVRLGGTLRLLVTGEGGRTLSAVTLTVVGTNITVTGSGAFNVSLAPGHYQLEISAPGYSPRGVTADIGAGNETNLGEIALQRSVVNTGAGDSTWLIVLVVAAGAAAVLIALKMRHRRPEGPQGPQDPH